MRNAREREADRIAEERLELMPRAVRDKLDRVGLKIHLAEWQALEMSGREQLRDLPCGSPEEIAEYASIVERLVRAASGKAPDRLHKTQA
jgi:hypothetical protein